jgi:hypothetical protein
MAISPVTALSVDILENIISRRIAALDSILKLEKKLKLILVT